MSIIDPYRFDMDVAAYKAAVLADSPLVFWEINEGSGTNIDDLTANNLDGTQTNASWATPGPMNQANALSFNGGGSDDRIERADNAAFDGDSIACSAWFKTAGGGGTVLARDNNPGAFSTRSFKCAVSTDVIWIRRFSGSGATSYLSPTTVPSFDDNTWHWACWKYTSSAFTSGFDGTDLGSVSTTGTLNASARSLTGGAIADGSGWLEEFTGELALIAFWPSPSITVADMIEHYAAGVTG